MAIIIGTSKGETLSGTDLADSIFGAGGNDILRGLAGDDFLAGGKSDDQLSGGLGNDTLIGGKGDDTYSVDSTGDQIIELANKGTDTVRTTLLSHTLGSNLENLAFIGSGNFNGAGNVRSNLISGGGGNDTLDGKEGNDRLNCGNGRDMLAGGEGNDTLDGGSGRDRLAGGSGADNLFGRDFNDRLDGGSSNDALDGGTGDDTLFGGSGSDVIEGGAGKDVAIFSGFTDDYTILNVGGKVEVVDQNLADGDDGTDILNGVEILQFKDGKLPPPPIVIDAIDLATLDGTKGFVLLGIDESDRNGSSVSSAGDVNGDGFDDVIIGAPNAEPTGLVSTEGESYLVFGKASWVGVPSLDLATLDGINGVRLIGIDEEDVSGASVSSAGDVNGDGFADLIVGAPTAESAGGADIEGESYVVFGKANWAPSLELAVLDGTTGFSLIGVDASDSSGSSVSSAGDLNGDGFADLLVGAPRAEGSGGPDSEGESYVVFGKASWAGTPSLDLAALDGANGFRLIGIDQYDYSGGSISSAGDVNGDGFDDLIIGAHLAENGGGATNEGESYVVFGKASWAGTPSLDLANLDGSNGFRLIGSDAYGFSGGSVSSAGDVNGDGFDDVIVGASGAGDVYREGESYVVFGKASWAGRPSLDLSSLNGSSGFRLIGIDENDQSGGSVASAGDVNGDGFDDLIVGAQAAEGVGGENYEGESYVVYGKASWAGAPALDLATLDGVNGFRLIGIDKYDFSGGSVSSAGDVNGDGFADLIVGAVGSSGEPPFGEGESYVVFGGNFSGAVTHLGGVGDDTLAGTAAAETFVGGTGNDTMIGKGGADSFQGGAGDDTIQVSTLGFSLADGGNGIDTLKLDGSALHLDLTTLPEGRTRSIERIDISATGNNMLTLSVRDVFNLSDESNELLVLGDAGDVVNRGVGWTMATTGGTNGNGTSVIDGETYQILAVSHATLLVDTDMSVNV